VVADPWGFLRHRRVDAPKRPIPERLRDWRVVIERPAAEAVRVQATRCMDCGVAFCHAGCPLGNLIPDWNDLVALDDWRAAIERLHATNNFPEFTGWLCPAPCEASCVLAINDEPVAIKQIELAIIERAFDEGWVQPQRPSVRTGRRVAVVGSGPAGLACAQQLTRAGHEVIVLERDDRIGGLLRYGIPDFKIAKVLIDRRVLQMEAEGTEFRVRADVGGNVDPDILRGTVDAVVLASGALRPRELDLPGRDLAGVHRAMEYLPIGNRVQAGDLDVPTITAAGKPVVIIGGGDTAADCLGTANRQGATVVHQVDHNPRPPDERQSEVNPWPQWPRTHKVSPAHAEGVEEGWGREAVAFLGDDDGKVRAVRIADVVLEWSGERRRVNIVPGSEEDVPARLVLLAAGFVGTEPGSMLERLGVAIDGQGGTIAVDDRWATSAEGVYACGDASRGASLVVWAIAEGRACAAAVDAALSGATQLPAPVGPGARPL
jgi:glutamate synthase (NADPH/NADH) small chain